jgi:DNA polymerase-3 subunit gamma/tau
MFVFCTTELQKVLPTVRSRCQTFVFQRPRLPELVRKLRRIADAEEIDVPDAALALIARGGRGAYRDAESTLDQLASATGGAITVQDVLQLLGAVEDEVLFRLCDLVVDGDTAGALVFLEELSEQGQDLGRLVTDLLEHLRHLLLVQHMGEVPDSLPVTEETRERLREQANQLPAPAVVRLVDLLHVAVEDMRQGGDPRLPLELALVKVTRPAADLSRESLAYRLERLEQGHAAAAPAPRVAPPAPSAPAVGADVVEQPDRASSAEDAPAATGEAVEAPPRGHGADLTLETLQEAWRRSVLQAVEQRSIPIGKTLAEAHPVALAGGTVTVEFPEQAAFHLRLAEDPKNVTLLREALYEVTGRELQVEFALGAARSDAASEDAPASEEDLLELMKSTFDARELDER